MAMDDPCERILEVKRLAWTLQRTNAALAVAALPDWMLSP
jgi:hypothetical protein